MSHRNECKQEDKCYCLDRNIYDLNKERIGCTIVSSFIVRSQSGVYLYEHLLNEKKKKNYYMQTILHNFLLETQMKKQIADKFKDRLNSHSEPEWLTRALRIMDQNLNKITADQYDEIKSDPVFYFRDETAKIDDGQYPDESDLDLGIDSDHE